MNLTEKIAREEMVARATNWEEWFSKHPDLNLSYNENGIDSVEFPDDCDSTLCAICNGEIKALAYHRKGAESVEFFSSKDMTFLMDLC